MGGGNHWPRTLQAVGSGILGLVLAGCGSPPAGEGPQGTDPTTTSSATTAASSQATPGVNDQRVLFGQSAALSGLAQELGLEMSLGINAAFHEANSNGGVAGRRLELITLDDTYEPELAIANTLQLIEDEQVFALIGEVGTPTSRSATPVAAEAGVPFVAPFTGAAFLRSESWDNIVNLRASYAQETEEMVARLTQDLGIQRIAIMYQDDSFGRTGLQGAQAALERRDMQPVSVGIYPRNTTAIKTGLIDLTLGEPEAVIVVGAYKPVAALIAWSRHTGFDPIFISSARSVRACSSPRSCLSPRTPPYRSSSPTSTPWPPTPRMPRQASFLLRATWRDGWPSSVWRHADPNQPAPVS